MSYLPSYESFRVRVVFYNVPFAISNEEPDKGEPGLAQESENPEEALMTCNMQNPVSKQRE